MAPNFKSPVASLHHPDCSETVEKSIIGLPFSLFFRVSSGVACLACILLRHACISAFYSNQERLSAMKTKERPREGQVQEFAVLAHFFHYAVSRRIQVAPRHFAVFSSKIDQPYGRIGSRFFNGTPSIFSITHPRVSSGPSTHKIQPAAVPGISFFWTCTRYIFVLTKSTVIWTENAQNPQTPSYPSQISYD